MHLVGFNTRIHLNINAIDIFNIFNIILFCYIFSMLQDITLTGNMHHLRITNPKAQPNNTQIDM
jgi:hypothetical protein